VLSSALPPEERDPSSEISAFDVSTDRYIYSNDEVASDAFKDLQTPEDHGMLSTRKQPSVMVGNPEKLTFPRVHSIPHSSNRTKSDQHHACVVHADRSHRQSRGHAEEYQFKSDPEQSDDINNRSDDLA
jgi:hypothetical protein